MSNRRATYYYALAGAIGGLIGWFLYTWALDFLPHFLPHDRSAPLVLVIVKGICLGAIIGAAICSRERLLTVDLHDGVKDGLMGALYGAVGGALSQAFAYLLFHPQGSNLFASLVAFILCGAVIGVSEGLKWRHSPRMIRGAVAGAIGGFCAALLYEPLGQYVSSTWGQALAWMLLGASLGTGISLVAILANTAILRVLDDRKPRNLPLGNKGPEDVIGRNRDLSISIPLDFVMKPRHAIIRNSNRDFFLKPEGDSEVLVNDLRLSREQQLRSGDVIKIAQTTFRFEILEDRRVKRGTDGTAQPETESDKKDINYPK